MPNAVKPPSIPKLGGSLNTPKPNIGSAPADISKIGKQGVAAKMPKPKAAPNAFAPPSVFFGKNEESPKYTIKVDGHDVTSPKSLKDTLKEAGKSSPQQIDSLPGHKIVPKHPNLQKLHNFINKKHKN